MFSHVPPRSATSATDVHPAAASPAPTAATVNGRIADISPMRTAAASVETMRHGCRRGLDEAVRKQAVRDRRVQLDPGHQPAAHRCLKDVNETGAGQSDEDDLVLEDSRIEKRLLPREELILRYEQVPCFVRRIRAAAVHLHGRAVVDQHRPLVVRRLAANRVGDTRGHERDPSVANADRVSLEHDLVGLEPARCKRRSDAERRQVLFAAPYERRHPARDAVVVQSEEIVAEGGRRVGQRLKGRQNQRPFFDGRPKAIRALRHVCRRGVLRISRSGAGVCGVGQHDDVFRVDRTDDTIAASDSSAVQVSSPNLKLPLDFSDSWMS